MTIDEYKTFWKKASLAYPDIAKFFVLKDFATREELTDWEADERNEMWKKVFLPLEYRDCERALEDMQAGRIEGFDYHPTDFPAKIRTQAREYSSQRAKEKANAEQREKTTGGDHRAGQRVRVEIHAGQKIIERRARVIFDTDRPDIVWPWEYLGVSQAEKIARYELWKVCVRQAMAELYPDADHPPTTLPIRELSA